MADLLEFILNKLMKLSGLLSFGVANDQLDYLDREESKPYIFNI